MAMPEMITELTTDLLAMEFVEGGRIAQLWVSDPDLPEDREEFQFCLGPLKFGEETSADYLPGTILIGARTHPSEPWLFARNEFAEVLDEYEFESPAAFEYDFPVIPELRVTGIYRERQGKVPYIEWELTIYNRSNKTVEIGELAFPFAFNNFYEGFSSTNSDLEKLWQSRVAIHQAIGLNSSWIFAQRLIGTGPGLVVFPIGRTAWELFHHLPATLRTPFHWEGIPIVYVHSIAAIEREGWPQWSNDHSSVKIDPGQSQIYKIGFAPVSTGGHDRLTRTLMACGKSGFRLLPAAVSPANIGIGIEFVTHEPVHFDVSPTETVQVNADQDESGGYAWISSQFPTETKVTCFSQSELKSIFHLKLIDRIDNLIKKRATYIATKQFFNRQGHSLDGAVLVVNRKTAQPIVDVRDPMGSGSYEGGLTDAWFLAEKNTLYPDIEQIELLDHYIEDFLLVRLQNPSDMTVGFIMTSEDGVGFDFGRPYHYPHLINLYEAMYRIARYVGKTKEPPLWYLRQSYLTAIAMFEQTRQNQLQTTGIAGFRRIHDLMHDLWSEEMVDEYEILSELVQSRNEILLNKNFPFSGETVYDTAGFEDVYCAAKDESDWEMCERVMRCTFALKGLSNSWWWYGSDKRFWDGIESAPYRTFGDKGETCLHYPTLTNALVFFETLDRDYHRLPEAYLRMAFGAMLGPWALVHEDGSASMCFCPDLASAHYGYNDYTGDVGCSLAHYLRCVSAYVLPGREVGFYTFGCTYEFERGVHIVKPWDGVGRRIILRQINATFEINFGCIKLLKLDEKKRWFELKVENPHSEPVPIVIDVTGLWGRNIAIEGGVFSSQNGKWKIPCELKPSTTTDIRAEIIGRTPSEN